MNDAILEETNSIPSGRAKHPGKMMVLTRGKGEFERERKKEKEGERKKENEIETE